MLSLVVEAWKRHNLNSIPVCWKCKCNRIAFISPAHKLGGICNNLVYIRRAGITDFCAPDNHALAGLSVYADAVHVGFYNM